MVVLAEVGTLPIDANANRAALSIWATAEPTVLR
jgi:hypothetical protein